MARLFDLNPQQLEAVRATSGPVLILAGAGTGKTRVITTRIAYLMFEGVLPEKILAVTFTNKAATEMRERVAGMVEKSKAPKVTICTFHALCLRILRQDIGAVGYKANFAIYDESDQLGLIRNIIARLSTRDEKVDPQAARALISRAKNHGGQTLDQPAVLPPANTLEWALFQRYQEELKNCNAVDFDDLLLLAVRLLASFSEIRAKWQDRYTHILVDEFQDTNRLQLELVRLLADPHRNVCVVGDDDQSIYGWRGAEIANLLEFERYFPNPKVIKLEQNYRSTNHILEAANSVIRHNPRRRPKLLWSAHGDGDKIRHIEVPDDREEANYVIGEIQRMQLGNGGRWSDFAVIFRMNAQSRLVEEQLRRLQIPYRIVGGRSFFERREVKDLLAYLSCLANPADDISLLRIINLPARGIGSSTIELAIQESNARRINLFETLRSESFKELLSQRTRNAILAFTDLIDRYETRINEPLVCLVDVVNALIEEIGYYAELRRSCKTPEEALNREENVREMLRSLAEYEARSRDHLPGFLAEIALDQEREEENKEERDGVTLITFHAAKGLEFLHVFLIGIEEGLLPHERSKLEGSLDEERRLFYVGITRAMRSLTITHCATRMRYGSASPCHPSSFLKDLDPRCVELISYHELINRPASEGTARSHFARMRGLIAES
jgi:ATP-dependent DNA helicase UvrD/PcrA